MRPCSGRSSLRLHSPSAGGACRPRMAAGGAAYRHGLRRRCRHTDFYPPGRLVSRRRGVARRGDTDGGLLDCRPVAAPAGSAVADAVRTGRLAPLRICPCRRCDCRSVARRNPGQNSHPIWVVTTALVVMQQDARASYRHIVERVAGTFAGVLAAWLITIGFHSVPVICACILLVAPLIPHHLANRYWLHTALIALLVLLAYDLGGDSCGRYCKAAAGTGHRYAHRLRRSAGRHGGGVSARCGGRGRRRTDRRNERTAHD